MMKVFVTVGTTIGSLGIALGLLLGAIFLFFVSQSLTPSSG
jgi:lipoprotein-releasing system permease protein